MRKGRRIEYYSAVVWVEELCELGHLVRVWVVQMCQYLLGERGRYLCLVRIVHYHSVGVGVHVVVVVVVVQQPFRHDIASTGLSI